MDWFFPALAAGGVPAIILHVAKCATGLEGGAKLTTALAGIGPGGMNGGLVTLGAVELFAFTLSKQVISMHYRSKICKFLEKGKSPAFIEAEIDRYFISNELKNTLRNDLVQFLAKNT